MHCPARTFRPILRSIGLLDIKIPQKEIISTDDRRTDRQTDGQTDGQTSRTTTIPSKQHGSETEAKFSQLQDVVTSVTATDPICFSRFRIKVGTKKFEAPLFQLSPYISILLIRLKCD